MLRVHAWSACLNDASAHTARKAHTRSVNDCSCVFKALNRAWVITDLDANFFQDGVGVVFENLQTVFRDQLIRLNQSGEVRLALGV